MVKKRHAVLIVFAFISCIYLLTISPTINWRDTPEFAHVSYSLGIAHPAGFPAYSLAAKLFTMLPFGSIAFKTNLFSLFFTVLSVIILFCVCTELLTHLNKNEDDLPVTALALIFSAFMAVNILCWENALIAEVYSYNMFFTVLLIYLLLKFSLTKRESFLYTAAFLYGISAGNHGTVAFYLPALLVFYFYENREKRGAKLFLTATFFLIGFSVYIYLPLRSLANPSYDWSNPDTLSRFITHVTDRKTSYSHFAAVNDYSTLSKNLYVYIKALYSNLTVFGIILLVIGAGHLFKRMRSFFYLLALILFSNSVFFFDWIGGVQLASYICYMIFIMAGAHSIIKWSRERGHLASSSLGIDSLIVVIGAIIVLISGVANYSNLSRANIYSGEDDLKETYLRLPENSIVILSYSLFHFRYYQDTLGLRRDLTVLGYGEIFAPRLYSALDHDKQNRVIGLKDDDLYRPPMERIKLFINQNITKEQRIFTEIISDVKGMNDYLRYFDGLLFEFTPDKVEKLTDSELSAISAYFGGVMYRFIADDDYKRDRDAAFIYIEDFINMINYLLKYGHPDISLQMIKLLSVVFDSGLRDGIADNERDNLRILKGVSYVMISEFETAEKIFSSMIIDGVRKHVAYSKLGFIKKYQEDYDEAIRYYRLAIEEAPNIKNNYIELRDIYEKLGKHDEAVDVYKQGGSFINQAGKSILESMEEEGREVIDKDKD